MSNPTIPQVLAESWARHVDRTALIDGERSITHGELAGAVAAASDHRAFGRSTNSDPTRPIAVIAPLGIEGTIIQLAAMFARRIVAPLEVWALTDQLVDSIELIDAEVVCLDPNVADALAERGVDMIDPTDLRLDRLLGAPSTDLILPDGDGHDPALLHFTSGTSGRPKGALVSHSLMLGMFAAHQLAHDDVIAITAPPSFVFSTGQTLATLTTGGTGVYVDLLRHSSERYHETVARHRVTLVSGTTPLLLDMAEFAHGESLSAVRGVHFASLASSDREVEQLRRVFPDATLHNSYGTTETGILTSLSFTPGESLPDAGPVPAGRAVHGVTMTVLDEDDIPVDDGAIGQLVVQLPHPFLGYWGDSAATAARIVTDADGQEWIRTGDLGRIDPDGVLHLLGRTDDLVKIRGRFVNPADIDAILVADQRVTAVATVAIPVELPRELRTVVVPADRTTTSGELRRHLAQSLPVHALPRHIIFVDSIALTERGKPDRQAIAALPPDGRPNAPTGPGRVGSLAERVAASLFTEVLDTPMGVDDDLFAAGGDSLAVAELLELLADECGVELSPADLVAHPTPASLAPVLEHGTRAATADGLVRLIDTPHPTSMFWFLGVDESFGPVRLARRLAPLGSWVVRLVGAESGEKPLPTLAAIGVHNAATVEGVRTDRTVLIGFSIGTVAALETAVALARRGEPADLLVLIDPPTESMMELTRRSPSLWRHPRAALEFHRLRRAALRRPFTSWRRQLFRHTMLFSSHQMSAYDGAVVIILSEHFATVDEPSAISAGLAHPPTTMVVPGTHETALVDVEPLAIALDEVLRGHGLT